MALWWLLLGTLALSTAIRVPDYLSSFIGIPAAARVACVAPRVLLGSWLLVGMLAEAEIGFVCAILIASAARPSLIEVACCLVVLLARLCLCGERVGAWVCLPAFVFIQRLVCHDNPELSSSKTAGSNTPAGQPVADAHEMVQRLPSWVPPTAKEAERWTKAFNLDDKLLAVYACTVRAKIAHRGYLFLSTKHVSFQAARFGKCNLQLSLTLSNIENVQDEEGNIGSTLLLRRPIQVQEARGLFTMTSIELCDCPAGQLAIAALVRRQHGHEEEDEFSETDTSLDLTSHGSACVVEAKQEPSPTQAALCTSSSEAVAAFAEGDPFRDLLEVYVPGVDVNRIKEDLLSNDWKQGTLILDHYERLGASDITVGPWIDDSVASGAATDYGNGPRLRELKMQLPVPPVPMCPKSTRMTATICLVSSASGDTASLKLLCTSVSHDVPFGDKFVVQEKIELTQSESEEGTRFRKHGRVVFIKSCGMLNSRISSSTAVELTKTGEKLVALLKQRACPSLVPSVPSGKVTFVVHIWELQRRATIWSTTWKPPFLPHDGKKRWRWVDAAYQKHAWMSARSREAAAASALPPIEPWQGYMVLKPWQVNCTSHNADDDGWQYALGFRRQDAKWGKVASGCSVRRRLWTCTFVEP
mmetsp:Transcript_82549/g.159465  ORF Transcript_82549/g.159465 Transcript_82549/m.159465 type:complete len:643 (-) Transcript_82549:447-2375(-)